MGKWVKGQSGNPGCRPKMSAKLSDLAKRETPAAFKRIIRLSGSLPVTNGGDKPSVAEIHKANQYIVDRAYGKPTAPDSGGTFNGATIIVDTGIRRTPIEPPTIDVTPADKPKKHKLAVNCSSTSRPGATKGCVPAPVITDCSSLR